MKKCLQLLFNHPLEYEDGVVYGFRIPFDDKRGYIFDYAVEEMIGKWCFVQRHKGKIEDISKWTDQKGRIYHSGVGTRLYSYTAALDTKTFFRIDEYWVRDNIDLENGSMITDAKEYFHLLCLMQDQDCKTGYNGFLQVYQRLLSKYQTLIGLADMGLFELDYDEQEHPHWESGCPKPIRNQGSKTKKEEYRNRYLS